MYWRPAGPPPNPRQLSPLRRGPRISPHLQVRLQNLRPNQSHLRLLTRKQPRGIEFFTRHSLRRSSPSCRRPRNTLVLQMAKKRPNPAGLPRLLLSR